MKNFKVSWIMSFLFVWLILALPIMAQLPAGSAARIVVIKPKEGMQKQFEDGYQRHLEWHRQNQDPWIWYGWQILSGERLGYFVDGTFGHRWEDFDAAVNPAGDATDNALNVAPYGNFISLSHYVLLPEVSSSRPLEEAASSPFVGLLYYHLYSGKESDFERILQKIHEAYGKAKPPRRYTWYKLVEGGEQPSYLLMLPFNKLAELQMAEQSFTAVLEQTYPEKETKPLLEMIRAAVRNVRNETMRYRADMSYFPAR